MVVFLTPASPYHYSEQMAKLLSSLKSSFVSHNHLQLEQANGDNGFPWGSLSNNKAVDEFRKDHTQSAKTFPYTVCDVQQQFI